jgi:polysaccharide biosynthesis transport protein
MTDHSMVFRDTQMTVTPTMLSPVIPFSYAYPGLSLAQIVSIVWAHRIMSIFITFAVLALTVTALSLWPRTYTAKATLMVNYEVSNPANGKDLPLGQLGSFIATQVELMQTPEVLLAVVDRLDLVHHDDYTRGFGSGNGTLREWVAAKLSNNLAIYQGQQGSQLIYVNYSARLAGEAAQIANTVIDVYKEQDYLRSTSSPGDRARHYAQQLEELKVKVAQAQGSVTQFHQKYALIDAGKETHADTALLATLEERLLEAQNERHVVAARASGDQSVSDLALASPQVQALKTQLAIQEQQMAHLNRVYTPRHPDILDLQSQMAVTRRSLASALQSYSSNASAAVNVAQRLERDLGQAVAERRSAVLAEGVLRDEATKYQLELESAQTVYKRALDGYDQVLFASASHYTNVSVISRATPPVKAAKPRILAGLAMGGIAAGFLGLGIPLAFDLSRRRVRCRDDLERRHGLPVLMEFGKLAQRRAA